MRNVSFWIKFNHCFGRVRLMGNKRYGRLVTGKYVILSLPTFLHIWYQILSFIHKMIVNIWMKLLYIFYLALSTINKSWKVKLYIRFILFCKQEKQAKDIIVYEKDFKDFTYFSSCFYISWSFAWINKLINFWNPRNISIKTYLNLH